MCAVRTGHATRRVAKGQLSADVDVYSPAEARAEDAGSDKPAGPVLRSVRLTGSFFLYPEEAIADLEAALVGTRVAVLGDVVADFFVARSVTGIGIEPADFVAVLRSAAG